MNPERVELMITMLKEVEAGTWKPAAIAAVDDVKAEDLPNTKAWFDMSTWLSTDGDPATCGFNACAIGHACLDQRFIDQGLEMSGAEPSFGGYHGPYAIGEFFGIDEQVVFDLFIPDDGSQVTAAEVRESLEKLLNS